MESIRSYVHGRCFALKNRRNQQCVYQGFSLVELLVVLAIITIITTVVFTSQGTFNKTITLSNTAYDVALTLRFAETYGLGSRTLGTIANTGYGLHFQNGIPNSFTLFADTNPPIGLPDHSPLDSVCHTAPAYDPVGPSALSGDCVYDSSEKRQDYTLGNKITIANFCAQTNGGWLCSSNNAITSLDIVFARPNPTPFMSKDGSYSVSSPVTAACITLTSPQGGFKYISVGSSGQISANASSCPLP